MNRTDDVSVDRVKNLLNNFYGYQLIRTEDKWDIFDLIDNEAKILVEVKERTNTHNRYKTTLLGYNKYENAERKMKDGYTVLWVFVFYDGCYLYQVQSGLKFILTTDHNYPSKKNINLDIKYLEKLEED
jgi:hypothetical protein